MATPDPSTDAVAKLKTACEEAYAKYPHSCSHSVWYIIQAIVDPNFGYLTANSLVDFLNGSSEWKTVSVDEGWALAQKGVVVIGGMKENPNGHVIVMYPGPKKTSGGYMYPTKDKQGKPTMSMLRSHGIYPPALSTSLGKWPGAMSKGDKTVWDPWANDDKFADVVFWTKK